jgi:hypothetical protein
LTVASKIVAVFFSKFLKKLALVFGKIFAKTFEISSPFGGDRGGFFGA